MEISDNIKEFLNNGNIASAMELLKQRVGMLGNWDIQSELEKVEFSYNSMLDFMLQNYVDADVARHRNQIILDMISINNNVDRAERYKERPADLYCLAIRELQNNVSLESIVEEILSIDIELDSLKGNGERESVAVRRSKALFERMEELRIQMFEILWISSQWNSCTQEIVNDLVDNDNIDENTRALAVSAVTLALLEYYDARKIMFLLDAYLSDNKVVSARAIVGFVLAIRVYMNKAKFGDELNDRLKLMLDDEQFANDIYFVCTQLQLSGETSTITKKMNTDILPSIMAGTNFKEAMSGLKKKECVNDENPEWDNYKIDRKAEKKIREMADMELDGADIYYSSFRLMKNYTFFNKLPHWFYPFDINSPFLSGKDSLPSNVLNLVSISPFCSNDLYSFTLSLTGLGGVMSTTLGEQIDHQMEGNEDVVFNKDNILNKMTFHKMIRFYIFDLYRFYHLMPQHRQFLDPYVLDNSDADFSSVILNGMFDSIRTNERLERMSEVFMRNGIYLHAVNLFNVMNVEATEDNAHYFQKVAFCKNMCGMDCIEDYKLAYSLNPHSVWTLKHLIDVLINAENSSHYDNDVISYCRELLAIEPENTDYIWLISCHLIRKNKKEAYREALEWLYKLQYIAPETQGLHISIAECLLALGDLDKACDYVIGSDRYRDTILGALIFIKEENYIGAFELLKMAWEQWVKDDSKAKESFDRAFNNGLSRMAEFDVKIDQTIARMLFDAVILR